MDKILIDTRESGTSTGRYVDKLIENLAKIKTDFEFIILAKTPRIEYLKKIAPKFTIVKCDIKEFTFAEQIELKKQIETLKPDLVHFPMVQQPVWYKGKVVTTMQDLTTVRFRNPSKNSVVFWLKQQVYKWVNKRVARKSTAIITPSYYVKDDIINFTKIDGNKITVTHESADKIIDKPEPVKELTGKKFLMYIGRPTPHKNLERLIEAFVILQEKNSDIYLALAGKTDTNYERIRAMVERGNIKNIIFTGFISDAELRWMYENCQVYVFPSLSEGFGLPGLEAMAHGAPVASSNATCLTEIYGDSAHYFNPYDVDDMAQKIADLLNDNKLRGRYIKLGFQQVQKYSWRRMAEQTLKVYKKA